MPSTSCFREITATAHDAYETAHSVATDALRYKSTSTSLEFKNIGGLLRIGVTGDASIASVMLSGNAGEPIAGHFEISKSDLASGSLDFAPGEGSAQFVSTSVTMTCTENVRLDANSPTYFYFALPAAEYTEGFTVTLTDSEGNTCLRQTHNSVSIERATLKSMEPIAFEKDKALTVTLGEIAANSVTWNIEGNPSTDLRTLLVTKAMWDHFIAQEYYLDNPQKLTSEILAAYSATIPTDDNGRYEETATQARAVNSMQPVQEDNDYLVLAAYFSGTQSVGVIPAPVPVHTPAATGPAPEVHVTVSSAGSTTIDVLTTTSNASGILTALFFKSDYDNVFSREGIDEELIAKYGNAWTAEQVEQANNGGYTLQYISLPPETEFVMLISVSSAAGKATLKKEIIATEPYVDLVGVEPGGEPVVLHGENVRAEGSDVVEQLAEAAGPVEQRDREAQPAVAGHEALLDDALDEAHGDVAAGEQAHDVFALHVDLALEHGGHGRGAGGLDDLLAALHEQEHGLGDLKIADGDDVVGVFLDERDGDVARRLDGDAVGDGGDGVGLDVAVRMERLRDRVRALGLHADDLYAGVDLLDARGHTGKQSAAAGRHDDDVRRGQVAEDLEAECALTGNDLGVIVGVQERGVLLLADLAGFGVGIANESQERMGLLIDEKYISEVQKIADRERAPH